MLMLNHHPTHPYLFESIIVPMTAANTGSFIEVSANSSLDTGIPINAGSLRVDFATCRNHFILEPHPTHTAHSGNIPSLPIILSSSRTNWNISSYLAVAI